MQLIDNLEKITTPFKNAVITIGNFDGVHIGHQALFHEVIERADANGGTSIAMTFEPHPIRVLKQNGHPPLITLFDQKIELIEKSGIDVLIAVPFTKMFAAIPAKEYVLDVLIKRIGTRTIVVGEDYTFGKNREGNINLLRSYAEALDIEVVTVDWIRMTSGAGRISSTAIRKMVMDGKVRKAQKLLGRHYQIKGVVVKGRNRGGKLLGFPTANINLHDELSPKPGVYAVTVDYKGKNHRGVANIGYSPTFDDLEFTVEVHLLDFDENMYDSEIRVNFIQRIRDEVKFSNIQELSDQITRDVLTARGMLT